MDGNIVSAGHFITAVLEHMGYLTQADYLTAFRSFFRDAGALIYFLAAVFSLISVLLYGSARAVRYLLLGPAIYWFLVGPVTEVEGVVWKLGGGQERGILGEEGREAAVQGRDEVIENVGVPSSRSIKVSTGFWLFAKPINDLVQEIVDLFLDDEDEEALMVADKVRGLELISRMLPNDPGLIQRLEGGVLKFCGESYHAALGMAESSIKNRATQGLRSNTRTEAHPRLNEIYNKKQADFNASLKKMIPTYESGFAEWIELVGRPSSFWNNLFGWLGLNQSGYQKAKGAYDITNNMPVPTISCAQAWDIFFEELLVKSSATVPDALRLTSGLWKDKNAYDRACRMLSRKLYDDSSNQECNLVPGIALATLWNHTSRGDTFGRVLARHSTYKDPLNPGEHNTSYSSMSQGFAPLMQKIGGTGIFGPLTQVFSFGGQFSSNVLTEKIEHLPSGVVQRTTEWAPNVEVFAVNGIDHATYISMPAYQTNRVRQQLLTWALQMPYYQGILLYFISIIYPFVCLLVLIPGKAVAVLQLPLFWLWVKSWDIGFAAIVLLEKVLYNMLPNWNLPPELKVTSVNNFWTHDKLPTILSEGYNFNHIQGIAMHYSVLALCTMSIPAWTGAFILKGKQSMLSSFTNAIDSQARNAGERSASAHSITSANERAQMMKQIKGAAIQTSRLQAGGVSGGLRGVTARFLGSGVAISGELSSHVKSFTGKSPVEDLKSSLKSAGNLVTKTLKEENDRFGHEAQLEGAMRGAYDPVLGRWGKLQMLNDAYAAALDGGGAALQGGFETNDEKANSVEAMVQSYIKRDKDLTSIGSNIAAAEGSFIASSSLGLTNKLSSALSGNLKVEDIPALSQNLIGLGAVIEAAVNDNESTVLEFRKNAINMFTGSMIQAANSKGYTADDLAQRVLSVQIGQEGREFSKNIYDNMDGSTIMGALYKSLHSHVSSVGGPESIGEYVLSMGGNRVVETFTKEEYQKMIDNGDILPDRSGDHWNRNIIEYGKYMFHYIHSDGANMAFKPAQFINLDSYYSKTVTEEELSNYEAIFKSDPTKYRDKFNEEFESFRIRASEITNTNINFSGTEKEVAFQLIDWVRKIEPLQLPQDFRGNPQMQFSLPDNLEDYAERSPIHVIYEVSNWLERQNAMSSQNNHKQELRITDE